METGKITPAARKQIPRGPRTEIKRTPPTQGGVRSWRFNYAGHRGERMPCMCIISRRSQAVCDEYHNYVGVKRTPRATRGLRLKSGHVWYEGVCAPHGYYYPTRKSQAVTNVTTAQKFSDDVKRTPRVVQGFFNAVRPDNGPTWSLSTPTQSVGGRPAWPLYF
jgi:hypothetical protein